MWLPILCERYGRAAHERRQRDDAVAVADAAPIQACARIRAVRYVSRLLTQRCSAGCKQCRDLVRHATTPYEQRQHALWEFFLQHRTDEWFREKYALDDVSIRARKHRRRAGRQHKAQWLRELHSGALDRVNFDLQQGGDDAPMYTVTNLSLIHI